MHDLTVTARLRAAVDSPHGLRILDRAWLPYGEMWTRACQAAGALQRLGVTYQERVAIVAPTSVEFLDAFFGCMVLGAVPVPLYPPVRLGRLEEYYERTAAMVAAVKGAAIVAPAAVRSLLGQVAVRCRPRLGVIASESLSGLTIDPVASTPDDLALIQYSSGTTVDPKPVGLTHRHILANLDSFLGTLAPLFPPEPLGVSWLPLYHDLGLIGFLLGAVCRPGTMVLIPPEQFLARPKIWLQAMSRFRACITAAPNFAYAYCLERISDGDLEGCDLSSWVLALNGAEQISAPVQRAFAERFARWGFPSTAMTPVYGLAEATIGVTASAMGQPWKSLRLERDAEIVSVGRPIPRMEVEIRRDGQPVPEREIGHIWVRGPSIPERYLDWPEPLLVNGWLDTGDLGFLSDGDLYISGRAKDVIILRGENHSPHEIERVVDRIAGIRTGCVAAVGQASEDGERLVVLAEVREKRNGLEDECRRAVMSAIGAAAEIHLLEPGTLPRTSSGKLRRQEALRRLLEGTLTPPARVTPLLMGKAWLDNFKGYRKLS
ncbi:MAG: AMP-binding protein [Candidatus Xenobia bacterium]